MTAQSPERLENQCTEVNLSDLYLYQIAIGDVHSNHGWGTPYPFINQPSVPKDSKRASFLWRGYVASYVLAPEGFLTLVSYEYPHAPGKPSVTVNERLEGDFWMVMKPGFCSPRTYIKFDDSRVVIDPSRWEFEEPKSYHQ